MNLKLKFAFVCYMSNVIGLALMGCIYVFGNEFLPFHSDVIQTSWEDVNASAQILYIGMMRTEGAGLLSSSLAIAILLFIPFMRGQAWSYWAMTAIGIVEHLPSLIATYHVSTITEASPPWPALLLGVVLLIVGLLLSISGNKTQQEPSSESTS